MRVLGKEPLDAADMADASDGNCDTCPGGGQATDTEVQWSKKLSWARLGKHSTRKILRSGLSIKPWPLRSDSPPPNLQTWLITGSAGLVPRGFLDPNDRVGSLGALIERLGLANTKRHDPAAQCLPTWKDDT